MLDIYMTEMHPVYQVWVDGKVYDTMVVRFGPPLTWSQQWDIVAGYKEYLNFKES